jgi:hypothetical protein
MRVKTVITSLVCALIHSVETSINPDLGFTRDWRIATEKNKNKGHEETGVA